MRSGSSTILSIAAVLVLPAWAWGQTPMDTEFTYQGQLKKAAAPVTDTVDMRFKLWDANAGGNQVGSTVTLNGVAVEEGLFTVMLDFGSSPFTGDPRWLEIEVKGSADPSFITLVPRQKVTAVPYALYAETAGSVTGGITGSGTTGYIPRFTGSTTLGNSVMYGTSGNVGVGTTFPQGVYAMMHVHSPNIALIKITNDGTGQTYNDGTLLSYMSAGSKTAVLWNREDAPLVFATNNTERVRIDAEGDVGIGTNSPSAPLHVIGDANLAIQADNYSGNYGGRFFAGFRGVEGNVNDSGSGDGSTGVFGTIIGNGGKSYGTSGNATGWGTLYGVYGTAGGHDTNYGVYGHAGSGTTNYAGYFSGNVHATGTLSKGGGSFKIDHPLDPTNKYLYHSFVESPDMMNVYNGNVLLDEAGEAWVQLPEWFEALNRDFRYQLTCIGGHAPVYIATEISDSAFRIAGGKPGLKVSWQVTGVRQDPFAQANRIPVEQDKPANERGLYLHPHAYGLPVETGIDHVTHHAVSE